MMELSREANDQNYTILVIYSNASPTTFGIITPFFTPQAQPPNMRQPPYFLTSKR